MSGYTAKGLPSGLKYDSKTGKITGAATKPTGDGGETVTFTKKNAATETLTIVVGAIPTVTLEMSGENDGDTDGCKVTGAGAYLVGKKVSLSATAPKGTAFLGWYANDELVSSAAKYSCAMTAQYVAFTAGADGKLSAKVTTAAGSYSFSATAWESVGYYRYVAKMTTKKGERFEVEVYTPGCFEV